MVSKIIFTSEQEQTICSLYVNGITPMNIGKQFNIDRNVVRRILKQNDIHIRNNSEAQIGKCIPENICKKMSKSREKIKTDEKVNNIIELYLHGLPPNKIGKQLNISGNTIRRYLKINNIPLRKRSESKQKITQDDEFQIIEMYNNKLNPREISEKLNVSQGTIRIYLKKNGIMIRNISESKLGKKLSILTCKKMSNSRMGKNNPMWKEPKDRVKPFREQIRNLYEYKNWRKSIFERDNYTCKKCNLHGGYLEAHHCNKLFVDIIKNNNIQTIEQAINCNELWDLNNGITLCKNCHNEIK